MANLQVLLRGLDAIRSEFGLTPAKYSFELSDEDTNAKKGKSDQNNNHHVTFDRAALGRQKSHSLTEHPVRVPHSDRRNSFKQGNRIPGAGLLSKIFTKARKYQSNEAVNRVENSNHAPSLNIANNLNHSVSESDIPHLPPLIQTSSRKTRDVPFRHSAKDVKPVEKQPMSNGIARHHQEDTKIRNGGPLLHNRCPVANFVSQIPRPIFRRASIKNGDDGPNTDNPGIQAWAGNGVNGGRVSRDVSPGKGRKILQPIESNRGLQAANCLPTHPLLARSSPSKMRPSEPQLPIANQKEDQRQTTHKSDTPSTRDSLLSDESYPDDDNDISPQSDVVKMDENEARRKAMTFEIQTQTDIPSNSKPVLLDRRNGKKVKRTRREQDGGGQVDRVANGQLIIDEEIIDLTALMENPRVQSEGGKSGTRYPFNVIPLF